jgi:Glycosyltransferase family 87
MRSRGECAASHPSAFDAALYGASAIAAFVGMYSRFPTVHAWGAIALPVYGLAGIVTAATAATGWAALARRIVLGFVIAGAAVAPMLVEIAMRARSGPQWAQAEVLVVEQAAAAVGHGRSPYGHAFVGDDLVQRADSYRHFPYLPGMAGFGAPHALTDSPYADARIGFVVVAAGVTWLALRQPCFDELARLRVMQFGFALPFAAEAIATGGDDIPVLALLLLGVALYASARPALAGVPFGLSMLLKTTAFPVVFCLLVGIRRGGPGRRSLLVATVAALTVDAVLALPSPHRFVVDTTLWPAGLAADVSPAQMPTLGALVRHGRGPVLFVVELAVVAICLWLVFAFPDATIAGALRIAAGLFVVLIVVNPVGRPGYLAYPVALCCWSACLARSPAWSRIHTSLARTHSDRDHVNVESRSVLNGETA